MEITLQGMILAYLLLLPGLFLLWYYRVKLVKRTLYSVLRMSVQLLLVGFYLKALFAYDSIALNLGWVLVMIVAANFSTFAQTELNWRRFLLPASFALIFSALPILAYFVIGIANKSLANTQITIPIAGMLLGNSLRGNVIAIDRFYRDIRERENITLCNIMLGATICEATLPFMQQALKSSINPLTATLATIGLVSLPGMMTGQMLGGASPVTAIQYQIAIMIAIFAMTVTGAVLLIEFTRSVAFQKNGRLHPDVFRRSKKKN